MPFQVKATVTGFLGDEERYPCHFQHNVGDEFAYDGEKYVGRLVSLNVPRPHPGDDALPRGRTEGRIASAPLLPLPVRAGKPEGPGERQVRRHGFWERPRDAVEPPYHMANLFPNPSVSARPQSGRS